VIIPVLMKHLKVYFLKRKHLLNVLNKKGIPILYVRLLNLFTFKKIHAYQYLKDSQYGWCDWLARVPRKEESTKRPCSSYCPEDPSVLISNLKSIGMTFTIISFLLIFKTFKTIFAIEEVIAS
jgi:hypothetical protein